MSEVQRSEADKGRVDTESAPPFNAYAVGVFYASVCSSLPLDETARRLNEAYPTGITGQWSKDDDGRFHSGQPNPTPCEVNPRSHKHWLFSC